MSTGSSSKIGVVLMTYGSATTAEHVPEYLNRIYEGNAPKELIHSFEERYRLIGRSPLADITNAQATALQKVLGESYVVYAGMRHSEPFIEEAVARCKREGADSLVGIILAPQFSSLMMDGYRTAFMDAARTHGFSDQRVVVASPWPVEPHFIELLAQRVQQSPTALRGSSGVLPAVVFTTHSLPQRVVESDPSYLAQLQATIDAIRARLDPSLVWYAGYQSAGHTREEWLTPDLSDILKKLSTERVAEVLIVPIQFLADHLEILYDLDIAARAQCEQVGIAYQRIELPNTHPLFIETLASVTHATQESLSR
jgi:protoporphyrin/coproporphyrin ferrochelatase